MPQRQATPGWEHERCPAVRKAEQARLVRVDRATYENKPICFRRFQSLAASKNPKDDSIVRCDQVVERADEVALMQWHAGRREVLTEAGTGLFDCRQEPLECR